jgi:hypothetical protein
LGIYNYGLKNLFFPCHLYSPIRIRQGGFRGVTITDSGGQLIEKGNAEPQAGGRLHWTYVAVAENAAPAGSKITVRAKDTPGNVITSELML